MANPFLELAVLPFPTSARFLGPDAINVFYSIRDHVRNVKRSVSKTLFLSAPSSGPNAPQPPTVRASLVQEVEDVVASTISPSGARVANLKEISDASVSGGKKRYVEIWQGDKLEVVHEVTSVHGVFYTDDHLLSLSFTPSEDALLYTAESHPPKDDDASDPFARFRFTPHFGEGLSGRKRPTLYLLRWRNDQQGPFKPSEVTVDTVEPWGTSLPSTPVLLGQATFASEDTVFTTGYHYTTDGRLLGIKGCFNRPASIWQLKIGDSAQQIEQPGRSSRSPRVFQDPESGMRTLVWISNALGGAHASCSSLHLISDCDSATPSKPLTIVDTVWEPKADGFPGLYPDFSLPAQPFLCLGPPGARLLYVVTHSLWRSRSTVLLISTKDGKVRDLTPDVDGKLYSWTVLCANERNLICARSSPPVPHEVVLGRFDENGEVEWQVIDKPILSDETEKKLASLKVTILPIPDRHPTETIVIRPAHTTSSEKLPPCVTVLHGGPHATSTTGFIPSIGAFALEGYTVALPNYTGSLGFGETYVRKLLGQCGTLDVQDCLASVHHLVKLGISELGPEKQYLQGGSHGGFLSGHLIGQYPDVFSAAIIRNPVMFGSDTASTDIPDWYYEEFGKSFTSTSLMTPQLFSELYAMSPVAHIDKVRARVLLLLGEADLRVSPTQAKGYYHGLKGRGKKVEMLCFAGDSHPLDGVEAWRVSWEAGIQWLKSATLR